MNLKKPILAFCLILLMSVWANPASSQSLWDAVQAGDVDQATTLLQNNTDPNLLDASGVTPLALAVDKANPDMVNLLLNYAADPNLMNTDSSTPLIIAAKKGLVDIVESLLNHSANPDYQDNAKMNAFDHAAESKVSAGLNGTAVVDPSAVYNRLFIEISN